VIDRKLRAGTTREDVSRWLTEVGSPITTHALGRHASTHLSLTTKRGRRPRSANFLTDVRDRAWDGVESGEIPVTLKDGIRAEALLQAQAMRNADRDLLARVALALTANVRVLDPEVETIEAEYRPLLTSGSD
jgi:hypothetical protein